MDLLQNGHIRHLYICKVFDLRESIEAFRFMQRGRHIDKVIISYEKSKMAKMPVCPLTPEL